MKCFFPLLKVVYKRGKLYSIVYILLSYLLIVTSVSQLIITQLLVNSFADYQEKLLTNILLYIGILVFILYVEGLMTSLRGVSLSHLKERGIFQDEDLVLQKSCRLSVLSLDSPEVKDLRENAKRFSFFDTLNAYIDYSVVVIKTIIYFGILVYFKCILLLPVIILGLFVKAKLQKKGDNRLEQVEFKQIEGNRVRDYLYKLLVNSETLQEIKITGNSKYLNDKRNDIYTKNYAEKIKVIKDTEFKLFCVSSVIALCNILSICLLVVLCSYYKVPAGGYVLLMQVVAQLYGLLPNATQGYGTVSALKTRYTRYQEYINLEEDQSIQGSDVDTKPVGVKVANMCFRYPNVDKDAVHNITLDIKPGERIALVGKNGSGKSTLVKLILGIYSPNDGNIQWYDLESISNKPIVSKFKVVFQDFVRLWRPVRENIAMGSIQNLDNDEMIKKALKKVDNEKFVNKLDEYLGNEFGGTDLSGGQWQRISIARSYMKKGGLAVFDEATSALDAKAELNQYQSFLEQGNNITSIIVTHRLSLTKLVDRIFVIDNGEIVEVGNHDELYKLDGKYRKMYDAQSVFYT